MRKIAGIVVLLAVVAVLPGMAATLAGVTLADTAQAGDTKLVLNGVGLRKKFVVKVYVGGLYLKQKSSDATAILKEDAPKRIVMHFVRGLSKSQLSEGFEEGFSNNSPEARKAVKADIDKFLGAITDVKEGDEFVLTYLPGTGTSFAINGTEKLAIADPKFSAVLFSVWLGPKPPNAELKQGLLGS